MKGPLFVSVLFVVSAGCSPILMESAQFSPLAGQEMRWERGFPVITSVQPRSRVLLAMSNPKHYPYDRLGFYILIENKSISPLDFGVESIVARIGSIPAKVISSEERIAEIQAAELGRRRTLALASALSNMSTSRSTTTGTFNVSQPGSPTIYGQYNQQTQFHDATAAAIRQQTALNQVHSIADEARQAKNIVTASWLARTTVDPGFSLSGYFELEAPDYPSPGQPIHLKVNAGKETHTFQLDQKSLCVNNCQYFEQSQIQPE